MEISAAQFARIEPFLPVQRGNVSLSNLQVINAILYVAEHGCKWRGLPKRFGNWHTRNCDLISEFIAAILRPNWRSAA